MQKLIFLSLALLVSLTSCVTKKQYDDLQASTAAKLEAQQKAISQHNQEAP